MVRLIHSGNQSWRWEILRWCPFWTWVFYGFPLPGLNSVRASPRHLSKAPHFRQHSTRNAMVRGRAMAEFKQVGAWEGWGWQLGVSKVGKCGSKHINLGRNRLDWTQCLILAKGSNSKFGRDRNWYSTNHLWDGLAVSLPLTPSELVKGSLVRFWHLHKWLDWSWLCCRWWYFKKAASICPGYSSVPRVLIPCWHAEN